LGALDVAREMQVFDWDRVPGRPCGGRFSSEAQCLALADLEFLDPFAALVRGLAKHFGL
jgi:hypothetical protein